MKAILGDGLTVPGDVDPKELKAAMVKYLSETPVVTAGAVSYKGGKNKYKVTLNVNGQTATITNIKKA